MKIPQLIAITVSTVVVIITGVVAGIPGVIYGLLVGGAILRGGPKRAPLMAVKAAPLLVIGSLLQCMIIPGLILGVIIPLVCALCTD